MGRRKILENVAEAWQPARIDNKKELTIIDAIEQVVVLAKESAFCPAFYRAAKRPLEYLAERLSLSVEQVALFAIFVNFSNDSRISLGEITEFAGFLTTREALSDKRVTFTACPVCRNVLKPVGWSGSKYKKQTNATCSQHGEFTYKVSIYKKDEGFAARRRISLASKEASCHD